MAWLTVGAYREHGEYQQGSLPPGAHPCTVDETTHSTSDPRAPWGAAGRQEMSNEGERERGKEGGREREPHRLWVASSV
eukprot:COSAG01_NODE_6513_length_3626_cov_5.634534_3_plen_79_part_00